MHRLLIFIVGGLVLLASALYCAPAQVLGVLLSAYAPQWLALSSPQGSLWRGTGELWHFTEQGWQPLLRAKWRWSVHLFSEQRLTLVLEHNTPQNPNLVTSQVSLSWASLQWKISEWPLPFSVLGSFLPAEMRAAWRDLKPSGLLMVQNSEGILRGLMTKPNIESANAQWTWHNAGLSLFPINPIGDYRITINPQKNGQWQADIATVKGPLTIEGTGTLARQSFRAKITLYAAPAQRSLFKPSLQFWGRAVGDDRYEIVIGSLGQ